MTNTIENIKDIKKSKPFKKGDIIVYVLIVILIVVLFIVFMNIKSNSEMQSISIYIDDANLFEYNCDTQEYKINDERISLEVSDNVLSVRVNLEKDEYNLIQIDIENKSAKMIESSCKTRDCVNSASIKSGSDVIICLPHHLKIIANGNELIEEVVSG